MNRIRNLFTIITLPFVLLTGATEAQDLIFKDSFEVCDAVDTVEWDGGGDGSSWWDELNWQGDSLPVDGDTVSLKKGGPGLVTYNSGNNSLRITCLDSSKPLEITGGTLEIDGNGWIGSNLTISNGTFKVTGLLGVSGTLLQSNGFMGGVGTVTVRGLFTWSGGRQIDVGETIANGGMLSQGTTTRYLYGRTLTLNAESTFSGTGAQRFWDGATLNNNAPLTIQTDADLSHYSGAVSTFNNSSTVTKSAGSTDTQIGANFNNVGVGRVTVNSGTIKFTSEFTQQSTATLDVHILGQADFDVFAVTKSAALDGTVNIIRDGYAPGTGTAFDIMTCNTCSGTFTTVEGNGVTFTQTVAADKVTLTAD